MGSGTVEAALGALDDRQRWALHATLSGLDYRQVADRLRVRPIDAARLIRTALTLARAQLDTTAASP